MIYVAFYNFIALFYRLEKLVNLRKVLVEALGPRSDPEYLGLFWLGGLTSLHLAFYHDFDFGHLAVWRLH